MSTNSDIARFSIVVKNTDHVSGADQAPVTLIEYGSYLCPNCANAHKVIKAIQNQFQQQLRFVFRHFPSSDFYPVAQHAAETALFAQKQGKFWEMHDCLFAHQVHLDEATLVELVMQLRLDVNLFLQEIAESVHVSRVQEDVDSGVCYGVKTTPVFFINGVRLSETWNQRSITTVIEQIIHAA